MGLIGVGLAVGAALSNAVASVLQRKVTRDESADGGVSVRTLLDSARHPWWLLGILSMIIGFVLNAVAITVGGAALVQPVLVVELPFTILLASRVFAGPVGRREWVAIGLQSAGLAVFLGCLAPEGGDPLHASALSWLVGGGSTVLAVAVLVVLSRRGPKARRAALLGTATGAVFGLNAALVNAAGAAVTRGVSVLFVSWQLYAVLVVGTVSFLLLQNALSAGSLVASQPGFTLTNPLVAVTLGLTVLGGHARAGAFLAGSVGGAVLIAVGTILLARAPVLAGQRSAPDRAHAAA